MVGIEFDPSHDLKAIQDWLLQSWIAREPDVNYRKALVSVLKSLWPKQQSQAGQGKKNSYIPLPMLCCQSLGGATQKIIEANAAWSLLYAAYYLLDKIEDHETDHPLFSTYGIGAVSNLTTGLILHAERILAEMEPDQGVDRVTIDDVRRAFNQRALEVCAGQHLDLTVTEPDFDTVWNMIDAKSGKFFALAGFMGARFATDDPDKVAAFCEVCRRLGIMIQIANDIDGLGSGAHIGSDLSIGKRTLPVVYALQFLPDPQQSQLANLVKAAPNNRGAEIEARKMIYEAGAVLYLSLEIEKHRQQAKSILQQLTIDAGCVKPLVELLDQVHSSNRFNPVTGQEG